MASDSNYLLAARALHLDAVTAEVVRAFGGVGIRSILLRGPAIGKWLYQNESARSYVDIDLLVEAKTAGNAARCLEKLGFADVSVEGVLPGDRPTHAHTWCRDDRAWVDLHTTIVGVRMPRDEAWTMLAADTDTITIAGSEVEILRQSARALMVSLHAAQHGAQATVPLQDLTRAIDRLPVPTWEAAASLAIQLNAVHSFAAGLRLLPAGEDLAHLLELPDETPVDVALRASTPPPMALGFEWLSQTPGWRRKASLAFHKIFPSATFMRAWSPLASRGPLGLALAYVWRPLWLLWHTPRGLRAWAAARKTART